MRGVQNSEGGWPKMARFSPGGSLPLDDLSVTSNRDGSFFIFLTSLFSSLHYLGRSNKLHVTLRCRVARLAPWRRRLCDVVFSCGSDLTWAGLPQQQP